MAVRRLLMVAMLLAATAWAQTSLGPIIVPQFIAGPYTIAASANQIPAASLWPSYITTVTDASSTANCTAGGGGIIMLCISQGGIWVPLTGSGATTINWGAPGAIGVTTPNTGQFTRVNGIWNYCAYSGMYCDGATDDTSAFNALLAAVYAAGGGTINGTPGKISLISGQITLPNDGANPPNQRAIKFVGSGASYNGAWAALDQSAFTLDLRYNASVAKIITQGLGLLEWTGTNFVDNGSDCAPFILTTNTTLQFHNNGFQGTHSGNAACNDAFILGGTDPTQHTTTNAAFQGYGTVIKENFFGKIRQVELAQNWANNIVTRDNTVSANCGYPTGAAFEYKRVFVSGQDNGIGGNLLEGNLIEAPSYKYGIELNSGTGNNVVAFNSCWDTLGSLSYDHCVHITGGNSDPGGDIGGGNVVIVALAPGATGVLDDSYYAQYNTIINGTNGLFQSNSIQANYSVTAPNIIGTFGITAPFLQGINGVGQGSAEVVGGDSTHTGSLNFLNHLGVTQSSFGFDLAGNFRWVAGTGVNTLAFINSNDATFYHILQAGTSADQEMQLNFLNHLGVEQTTLRNASDGTSQLYNPTTTYNAVTLSPAGVTTLGNVGKATYLHGTPIFDTPLFFTGTTASIGGSALLAGACASGTASVTGATVGHPVSVSASDGTLPNALATLSASVTSGNTVTVQVCAIAAVTPTAKTYNVTTQ